MQCTAISIICCLCFLVTNGYINAKTTQAHVITYRRAVRCRNGAQRGVRDHEMRVTDTQRHISISDEMYCFYILRCIKAQKLIYWNLPSYRNIALYYITLLLDNYNHSRKQNDLAVARSTEILWQYFLSNIDTIPCLEGTSTTVFGKQQTPFGNGDSSYFALFMD